MSEIIATHNGKFHADDVFAVAALLLLKKDASVVRTRDEAELAKADIVVDVGGVYDDAKNHFDHHQIGGAGMRANGTPYAAFGLVWQKFGTELAGSGEVATQVDTVLVLPIDANDNGIDLSVPKIASLSPYDISDAIRAFVPTWQEGQDTIDVVFDEAVSFAKRIIVREIKRAEAIVAGQRKVTEAYRTSPDKRLILLDGDYSWKDTLAGLPEPLFVIHPQGETWRLYSVRDNPHVFVNRKDLPEKWAGLRNEELAKVTGVPDAVFCHRNRFLAAARSKEGALALAKLALSS